MALHAYCVCTRLISAELINIAGLSEAADKQARESCIWLLDLVSRIVATCAGMDHEVDGDVMRWMRRCM